MEKMISVSQYCKKYRKDSGNVRRLLASGRLNGMKIGNQWVINEYEEYPNDLRIKTGSYINYKNKKNLNKNKELMKNIKKMNKEIIVTFKNKITRIVIYGSYARNEQTSESDVDIAVIVKNEIDQSKLNQIVSKYELEANKVLSVLDINEKKYNMYKKHSTFYKNIEKEGIELWRENK